MSECTSTFKCIRKYARMYVCNYLFMCACMHAIVYVFIYLCVYARMYLCMCVDACCVYAYMHLFLFFCMSKCVCVHSWTAVHVCMDLDMYVHGLMGWRRYHDKFVRLNSILWTSIQPKTPGMCSWKISFIVFAQCYEFTLLHVPWTCFVSLIKGFCVSSWMASE